jgi:hypothetical protein
MVRLFFPFSWGPLMMAVIAFWLGRKEAATYKVLFLLVSEWSTINWAFGLVSS